MDVLEKELENPDEMTSESENVDENNSSNVLDTETCKYISDDISTNLENVSRTTTVAPQTKSNETSKNQLLVFEPNSPIMERFQNTLKQHLLKQRDTIKNELLLIVSVFTRIRIPIIYLYVLNTYEIYYRPNEDIFISRKQYLISVVNKKINTLIGHCA